MSKIVRYTGNLRAFGSNAQGLERTLFGETNQADDLTSQVTAAFLRGWGIVGPSENPSLEDFNAAMYTMSQFIAYQHQMGVPEWDAAQEYYIGSLCVRAGETYASLANSNINSAPPSAKWTQVITVKNGLTSLGLADVNGFVGRLIGPPQVLSSTGTYTRSPGAKNAIVEAVGGGAAGGGATAGTSTNNSVGGGGGGGAYVKTLINNIPASVAYTIGSGGVATTGGAGSDGGQTTFGSYLTCPGGVGAGTNSASNAAALAGGGAMSSPPTVTNATTLLAFSGQCGTTGVMLNGLGGLGGNGAGGPMGSGARGSSLGFGPNGSGNGSGGGGALNLAQTSVARPGGNGTSGLIIVWEYA